MDPALALEVEDATDPVPAPDPAAGVEATDPELSATADGVKDAGAPGAAAGVAALPRPLLPARPS